MFTQWTPAALCQTRFIIFVLCRAVNTSNAACFITSSLPFCLPSHHSITLLCLELCFPSANLFLASVMYWCKLINATLCGGPGIENTSIRNFRREAYAYVREIVNNVILLAPADHDETEPPNKHSRSEASAFKFLMGNCSASDQVSTEFDHYVAFDHPSADHDKSVLAWWQRNASTFPKCAQVARKNLAIPVKSVQSERQSELEPLFFFRSDVNYCFNYLIITLCSVEEPGIPVCIITLVR